jgi:Amt family ammonium transporter
VVKGLFFGGGTDQLVAQAIGSACVTVATLAAGMALIYAVKATGTLRVSREGEEEGLDLHEHGGPAYPELGGLSIVGAGSMKESAPMVTGALAASK